jgi:hypothetical protein
VRQGPGRKVQDSLFTFLLERLPAAEKSWLSAALRQ